MAEKMRFAKFFVASNQLDENRPTGLAKAQSLLAAKQVSRVETPAWTAHEELIFLLQAAAEIEHSLMVQYLYAAFSLDMRSSSPEILVKARSTLSEVATEEMGHLVTIENLLRLLGGATTLDRADYPFLTDLYPFPFALEPVSVASIAKYVLAEMPPNSTFKEVEELKKDAACAFGCNGIGMDEISQINQVGKLYKRMLELLDSSNSVFVADADIDATTYEQQMDIKEWGLGRPGLIIKRARSRDQAIDALKEIAEQGEGIREPVTDVEQIDQNETLRNSHFARFYKLYRQAKDSDNFNKLAQDVISNPHIHAGNVMCDGIGCKNCITLAESRLWAELFNRRYKLLLQVLIHAFQLEGTEKVEALAQDRTFQSPTGSTVRGMLISWSFGEMYNLRSIAHFLTALPATLSDENTKRAAPPFEMPYIVSLPDREIDKWRSHRDIIRGSANVIKELAEINDSHLSDAMKQEAKKYLQGLNKLDSNSISFIAQMMSSSS